VIFDPQSVKLLHKFRVDSDEYDTESSVNGYSRWIMTNEGLEIAERNPSRVK
jgi:hypothetical protein